MQRRQVPDGYTSSFTSYTDPVIPEPPPPIIEQKQAETLMSHCLKQFIKQRLYGNMINHTRKTNEKQVKFTPYISSIPEESASKMSKIGSVSTFKTQQERRLSQVRENIEKRMNKRYSSIVKNTNSKLQQQKGSYRHSLGNIESSLIEDSQRQRKNRSALTNKYSLQSPKETEKSFDNQMEKYKCSSFISAIQDEQLTKSKIKQHRLSPIPSNNRLSHKLEKIRAKNKASGLSPSPTKIQVEKFVINPNFWEYVCKKPKKNQLQLDNSIANLLTKDNSSSILENKSFGSLLTGKSNSQLQNIGSLDKSKYFLTKPNFSKELYMQYLSNTKFVVKSLAQAFFQFFELNSKIYDDMKTQDYKAAMELITTASPRVWAVCAFRFWDTNFDSLICSSDIFKIFKELDCLKTELQESYSDFEAQTSYKILTSLLKTIESLREITLEQRLEDELQNQDKNKQTDKAIEIKYLEESILKKKDIKYSDLLLILGHNIKIQTKQTKKSVIETTRQIRIKMSSCYRYSFLATDHNEQTRQDRQHIEMLKESLKQQKIDLVQLKNDNQLINKKIPGINYTTFVEKKLYRPMKELAYIIFGIQSI